MTIKECKDVTGGLSKTEKMPCLSYSTSAKDCNMGRILKDIPGSICALCYGERNNYKRYEKTIYKAHSNRLNKEFNSLWIEGMITLISKEKSGFFRWFDCGDIKNLKQLEAIMQVIENTPNIKHWLPTKEYKIVKEYLNNNTLPENVTIRYSAYFIDKKAPAHFKNTSTVYKNNKPKNSTECLAYKRGGACKDCRDCWNKDIKDITYKLH